MNESYLYFEIYFLRSYGVGETFAVIAELKVFSNIAC